MTHVSSASGPDCTLPLSPIIIIIIPKHRCLFLPEPCFTHGNPPPTTIPLSPSTLPLPAPSVLCQDQAGPGMMQTESTVDSPGSGPGAPEPLLCLGGTSCLWEAAARAGAPVCLLPPGLMPNSALVPTSARPIKSCLGNIPGPQSEINNLSTSSEEANL
ncbi:unnamed protein product [Pleuronectes platessa]|uniref:Uncharacterized protein n=1 Tax=Pleuronectes platessa TaxID=8262 RepID=A0A9N7UJV0_PLEPL|nr:unnamed protein product [Pleuronectes platessa]